MASYEERMEAIRLAKGLRPDQMDELKEAAKARDFKKVYAKNGRYKALEEGTKLHDSGVLRAEGTFLEPEDSFVQPDYVELTGDDGRVEKIMRPRVMSIDPVAHHAKANVETESVDLDYGKADDTWQLPRRTISSTIREWLGRLKI